MGTHETKYKVYFRVQELKDENLNTEYDGDIEKIAETSIKGDASIYSGYTDGIIRFHLMKEKTYHFYLNICIRFEEMFKNIEITETNGIIKIYLPSVRTLCEDSDIDNFGKSCIDRVTVFTQDRKLLEEIEKYRNYKGCAQYGI